MLTLLSVLVEQGYDRLACLDTRIGLTGAVILAGLVYAGIGLVMPLGCGVSALQLAEWSFLSVMLAALLIVGGLTLRLEARDRRHTDRRRRHDGSSDSVNLLPIG